MGYSAHTGSVYSRKTSTFNQEYSTMEDKGLKKYMTPGDRAAVGNVPTQHTAMIALTGKARPGKTARDRARREDRNG